MIAGVWETLVGLAECAAGGLSEPAGRVLVAPGGEVAWDSCCDGMVWSRLVEVRPGPEPARTAGGEACGPVVWEVRVGVGVLRCTPVVDDRGRAPSPDALTENAERITADMREVLRAIECCAGVARLVEPLWSPLGPEGGCAGGEWTFGVFLAGCGCDETEA